MKIEINMGKKEIRLVVTCLVLFEILLVAIFALDYLLAHPSYTIHKLFDLDKENTIPTWFASIQLFVTGGYILLIPGVIKREGKNPLQKIFYYLFGFAFIFLSMDEACSIHEKVNMVIQGHFPGFPHFVNNYGHWVFPYLVALALFLILVRKPLLTMWKECRKEAALILGGIALVILGGIVMEIIGFNFYYSESHKVFYRIEVVLEEFFEMAGVTLILYGFVLHSLNGKAEVEEPDELTYPIPFPRPEKGVSKSA
jgi:hypothetical protein